MAGARGHKYGTIFSRLHGMIKTNLIPQERRPLWYDIWKEFPPKVLPDFQKPIPEQNVKQIFYPEDLVRAKIDDTYRNLEAFDLRNDEINAKSHTQRFVETYIELQTPGKSVDTVLSEAEKTVDEESRVFQKKTLQAKPSDNVK